MTKDERKVWRHSRLPFSLPTLAILGFTFIKVLIRAL